MRSHARRLRRVPRRRFLLSAAPSESTESAFWFHSIDLGDGVVTPGLKSPALLDAELAALRLPDLRGKSVLDVGAWDGFYSFEAERRGASRVVALDHYVWSLDLNGKVAYEEECRAKGRPPQPLHTIPRLWKPDELPGKRAFDIARSRLGSGVEPLAADFMEVDLDRLGSFDVVLYLGVLYHMEDPLAALSRLAQVTREVAVIESEAVHLPDHPDRAICEFFPGAELNFDPGNWWAPTVEGLRGLCQAAGFGRAEAVEGPEHPYRPAPDGEAVHRYRAIVHAWK